MGLCCLYHQEDFLMTDKPAYEELKERAIDFLTKIPAEKNNITRKWAKLGIKAKNAFYSQALIQLKNEYCNKKFCLNCHIGNKIITSKTI